VGGFESSRADTVLADTVAGAPRTDAAAAGPGLPAGSVLGRYMVLDHLGRGGMGVVYAAYDPHLDRRVALKLLSPERYGEQDATDGRNRLLREAQAIARLAHPNVVAVHDVGVIDDEVFVAMEYVDGETLGAFCAEEGRTRDEIVAAFAQAARGLAAAHAKGLVHRDFKPDNVLVDKEGRARVLDFGLARAEGRAAQEAAPSASTPSIPRDLPSGPLGMQLTRAGALLGTPRYMAPEQLDGGVVDARSDQFAFGVALYEALYRGHPFGGGDDLSSLIENVRRAEVCAEPVGRKVPAKLRALLLRALERDPAERYPSMLALLADLSPPPLRRRTPWLVTAAVAAAAIVGLAAVARASRPKPGAECAAADAKWAGVWDDARRSATDSAFHATGVPYAGDAVRGVDAALDAYASAWSAARTDACLATRVRGEQSDEMLDLRMQCLDERLADARALTDLFVHADATTVEHAVSAAQSLRGLEECANAKALRASVLPPRDAQSAAAIAEVREVLARARADDAAGRYAEEHELATGARERAASVGYDPLLAEADVTLALADGRANDERGNEQADLDAIVAAEASHDDAVAAEAWEDLTYVRGQRHEYAAGRESGQIASAAIARIGGDVHLSTQLEIDLGKIDRMEARYDDARGHYERAIALARGHSDDLELKGAYRGLAFLANNLGRYEESVGRYQDLLAIEVRALGPEHPAVAEVLLDMAQPLESLERYDEATAAAKRALAIWEGVAGAESADVASALHILGNIERDRKHIDRSIDYTQRALAVEERAYGPDSPKVANLLNDVAMTLVGAHRYDEARGMMERARDIYVRVNGPEHPTVCMALVNLAQVERESGHPARARADDAEAVAVCERAFKGADHRFRAIALTCLGQDYVGLHQPMNAGDALEKAVAMWGRLGLDTGEVAQSRFFLAKVSWDNGVDRPRAVMLAQQARAYYAAHPGSEDTAQVDAWLAAHGR
jgi:tetratricopeptide (TPR) repeat protein/tRNA A-37 threonylcarbamoyl transferase component Bud32